MMKIDINFFHHVCILALYGAAGVLTFVLAERLVYYALIGLRVRHLDAVINRNRPARERTFKRRDVVTRAVAQYLEALSIPGISRTRLEDLSMSQFIHVDARIVARIWLLDTIVTAAPLLGLLGTILGIMDTFTALSSGGISDPAAVSRGIAAALLATAIGIGVALYGLLAHNLLFRLADDLKDNFKRLVLGAEAYRDRTGGTSDKTAGAAVAPAVAA